MSDLAASGGYYIACRRGRDRRAARPRSPARSASTAASSTCSASTSKLGLNVETVSRGRHAEMLSPFRDFTPEEAERFQRAARGRLPRVPRARRRGPRHQRGAGRFARRRAASGAGSRRCERGLVDTLGGLDAAFAHGARAGRDLGRRTRHRGRALPARRAHASSSACSSGWFGERGRRRGASRCSRRWSAAWLAAAPLPGRRGARAACRTRIEIR